MAAVQTSQIAILFQLMLAKAGKTPTHRDFKKVSEEISNSLKADAVDISPAYLNEQHLKMIRALEHGATDLGWGQSHIDACCKYIGFESYVNFQRHCDQIMSHLKIDEIQNPSIEFYYHKDDYDYLHSKLDQSYYPGQERHLIDKPYSDDLKDLSEELSTLKVNDRIIVWCLPLGQIEESLKKRIDELLKKKSALKNIISIFPEDGEFEFKVFNPIYENTSFYLVIAACEQIIAQQKFIKKTEPHLSGNSINVYGNGSVVVGNVKSKYYSAGDIQITKKQA